MNDRNRLLKELMGILEDELGTAPEGVSEETFLRESLGLDSVDMITVISRVEQAYKIRLNHEELTQMNKVSDIINVILSKTEVTPMRAAALLFSKQKFPAVSHQAARLFCWDFPTTSATALTKPSISCILWLAFT